MGFVTEKLANKTAGYRELENILTREKITVRSVYSSDFFKTSDGVLFRILGPSKEFLAKTSPDGVIGETREFSSMIQFISFGNFSLILDGDSQVEELEDGISTMGLHSVDALQISHHGSKTGLNNDILDQLHPKLAVISVGKNKYGHPTSEILKMLQDKKVKVLRTDQHGSIELVSDGKRWWVY